MQESFLSKGKNVAPGKADDAERVILRATYQNNISALSECNLRQSTEALFLQRLPDEVHHGRVSGVRTAYLDRFCARVVTPSKGFGNIHAGHCFDGISDPEAAVVL